MMSRGKSAHCSLHSSPFQDFGLFLLFFKGSGFILLAKYEMHAVDSTQRSRHCSSSCLWQTDACACTHIHINTHKTQTHSSAEGSRWSLSHWTPFCQTPQMEISTGAIRQDSLKSFTMTADIIKTLHFFSNIASNTTATQVRQVQRNECGIPTSYVDKQHTP